MHPGYGRDPTTNPLRGHAAPGWRRRIALVLEDAILLIDAAGLCVTYGPVMFG
jgi:hypothetical protein